LTSTTSITITSTSEPASKEGCRGAQERTGEEGRGEKEGHHPKDR